MLTRVRRFLSREVIDRPLPHGLLGWRCLWPGDDERVRVHRRLWWMQCQRLLRPMWLCLELALWLRWNLWHAWLGSWRVVRRLGPEIRDREGLSIALQARRTLALALGWSITPRDVYRFQLYRRHAAALDYVYDHEVPAFHRWRSDPLGLQQASVDLLQDKIALAEELGARGIPVVPTLTCCARRKHPGPPRMIDPTRANPPLAERIGALERVFCKTRSGNRGLGAFEARRTATGMAGRCFEGRPLPDSAAVEAAWQKLLSMDDALIQPLLANQPMLAPLAHDGEAITVRFISEWQGATPACLSATLEIPAGRDEVSGRTYYAILPIAADSGRLLRFPDDMLRTNSARNDMERIWALAEGIVLPYWDVLMASSFEAQRRFPDVWAIAWDWVITPEGPLLLEGNSGWSTAIPQLLTRGFLREANRAPAAK